MDLSTPVKNKIAVAGVLLFSLVYLILAWRANTDLASSRFYLSMDEQIVFSQIRPIVTAGNWSDLLNSVLVGTDQRYGRIFYNVTAFVIRLFSGNPSDYLQIVTTRMVQAILLLAAYLILIFSLLKRAADRLVGLLFLLGITSTTSYAAVPKPEPIQLLLIAVFLAFYFKRNFKFGRFWWFLGAAFGAKISTLPIVVVAFIVSVASYFPILDRKRFAFDLLKAILLFFSGWIVAVPLIGLIPFHPHYWTDYLSFTFRMTNDELDFINLGINDRLLLLSTFLEGIGLLYLMIFFFKTVGIFILKRRSRKGTLFQDPLLPGVVLMGMGFVLNLLVLWHTKRLWTMYLHTGTALLGMGYLRFAEEGTRFAYRTLIAIGGVFSLLVLPHPYEEFIRLSHRSTAPEHEYRVHVNQYFEPFFDQLGTKHGRLMTVRWDPFLYSLAPSDHYKAIPYWGIFRDWNTDTDAFILSDGNDYYQSASFPSNPLHKEWIAFRKEEEKHLVDKNKPKCEKFPCFEKKYLSDLNLTLYLKSDLIL